MISLRSTIEKIKSLETEKKNIMLEIEELKKTAETKAASLESEVNALRDELESLRLMLEESESNVQKRQSSSESVDKKKRANPFKRALKDLEKF